MRVEWGGQLYEKKYQYMINYFNLLNLKTTYRNRKESVNTLYEEFHTIGAT